MILSKNVKNIIFIKGSSIGDIITGIPILRNLRKNYPNAEITLVSSYNANGESIVKSCPYLDDYIVVDYKNMGLFDAIQKIKYLRKKKADIIINGFPTTSKTSILTFLLNGRYNAGIRSKKKSIIPNFFDLIVDSSGKDAVDAENEILRELGFEENTSLELFFDIKKSSRKINGILKKNRITKNHKIIGLYFGKNVDICRSWVNEKWAEMINEISKKRNIKFVFIGGRDSLARGNYIEKISKPKIINLIGKLSLDETVALMKKCTVFVSTNGGPMQIAAAIGTPQIVLNGSSLPEWYPHSKNAINLRDNSICKYPCGNDSYCSKCKGRSIKNIKISSVIKSVNKFI